MKNRAKQFLAAFVVVQILICMWVSFQMIGEMNKKTFDAPGFTEVLKVNPRSDELDKAFVLFEAETKKSRNDMSYYDIAEYVTRIRKN